MPISRNHHANIVCISPAPSPGSTSRHRIRLPLPDRPPVNNRLFFRYMPHIRNACADHKKPDTSFQERLSVLAAPRMVRSTFLFARLRSAGGVYLSGGLKPATETSRILTYPPLIEAEVFPTEINLSQITFLQISERQQRSQCGFVLAVQISLPCRTSR